MSKYTEQQIREVAERRYWRKADGEVIVRAWEQSGDSMRGFAMEHGIAPRRLARWRRIIEREGWPSEQVTAEASARPQEISFFEVRPSSAPKPAPVARPVPVSISVPSGIRVNVRSDIGREDLMRILEAVAGVRVC